MEDFIQIAGVIDQTEADLLVELGAPYLGFPLRLPDGREDLSEPEAARIIGSLEPRSHGILITYLAESSEIAAFCRSLGATRVQLHGPITPEALAELRASWPDLFIIKSLVVREGNLAQLEAAAVELAPWVDAFITDTYDPATGRSGATGKVHDWRVSRRLVEAAPRPVILAGGLDAHNVRCAIRAVRPAGVDSHTGVEGPDGRKSREQVARFLAEARDAFAQL